MVANPPITAAEKNDAKRKAATNAFDRKLKAVLGDPNFYGRVVITAVVQQGQAGVITIETSETMKT